LHVIETNDTQARLKTNRILIIREVVENS